MCTCMLLFFPSTIGTSGNHKSGRDGKKKSTGNGNSSSGSNTGGIRSVTEKAAVRMDEAKTFEAYRKEYRSFRVGHAKGAKGELTQFFTKSIRKQKFGHNKTGVLRSDSGSDPLGSSPRFSMASYESAYLASIADDTPVYTMLKRLSPYFHGKHPVQVRRFAL